MIIPFSSGEEVQECNAKQDVQHFKLLMGAEGRARERERGKEVEKNFRYNPL